MFGYCGSMGLGGWLLMTGFWVGLVALVLWAVGRMFPAPNRRTEPEDLLAQRLATGEIDAEAYREAREQLAAGRR